MRRSERPRPVPAGGDGDGARCAVQRRSRVVAREHALGAAATGGSDHDEISSVALGDRPQCVRWRAVGDNERSARRAGMGELGLDQRQHVFADHWPGRAGMRGDELAAGRRLKQRGKCERIATALAAVDADDDAGEHRILLLGVDRPKLRRGGGVAMGTVRGPSWETTEAARRRTYHRRSSSAPQTMKGNGSTKRSSSGVSAAVPSSA